MSRTRSRSLWQLLKAGAVWQYLVVGVLVFGIDYLAFFICYQLVGFELALATAIAYVIGLTSNFMLLRYWAFARTARRDYLATSTLKYVIWLGINYCITYAVLKYLQLWLDITPYLGKFAVAFFMTFWNYAGYKLWVFKGPRFHSVRFKV